MDGPGRWVGGWVGEVWEIDDDLSCNRYWEMFLRDFSSPFHF